MALFKWEKVIFKSYIQQYLKHNALDFIKNIQKWVNEVNCDVVTTKKILLVFYHK